MSKVQNKEVKDVAYYVAHSQNVPVPSPNGYSLEDISSNKELSRIFTDKLLENCKKRLCQIT